MRHALYAAVFALLSGAAFAQSTTGPGASGDRFQIERQGENLIRLDRKTGAISTCRPEGGGLDCKASADERAALQAEIDRLSAEVEDLKAASGTAAAETGIGKDGKELTLKLPSESEIKEVMTFFEDMLRRFVAAVKSLVGESA